MKRIRLDSATRCFQQQSLRIDRLKELEGRLSKIQLILITVVLQSAVTCVKLLGKSPNRFTNSNTDAKIDYRLNYCC